MMQLSENFQEQNIQPELVPDFAWGNNPKRVLWKIQPSGAPIKVKMRYTKEVLAFIRKIEEAHQKAANSRLHF